MDIHVTDIICRISLHGYPCLGINMAIHTCGELKTDIQKSWILICITVDFRKSMLWILGLGVLNVDITVTLFLNGKINILTFFSVFIHVH